MNTKGLCRPHRRRMKRLWRRHFRALVAWDGGEVHELGNDWQGPRSWRRVVRGSERLGKLARGIYGPGTAAREGCGDCLRGLDWGANHAWADYAPCR